MSKFKTYITKKSVEIEPEEVQKIRWVNGVCTDIEVASGETIRVKGNVSKVQEKLGIELKPGLKRFDET